ncbi:MAG: VOC family protein [Candidatus Binatia bacterium]
MRVEKIDHIHIYVKELDKAITFFSDILGTKFSDIIVDDNVFHIRSALDRLGLELVESLTPDGAVARTIQKRGEGLAAISLKVPDLEEAVKELQAKGLNPVSRIALGKIKEVQFHPKDAHGVMIELCEYEEESGAARAALTK